MLHGLLCCVIAIGCLASVSLQSVSGVEPPANAIDKVVLAKLQNGQPLKAVPSKVYATFFRRLHLDLAGTPPTADAARRFLADSGKDRAATVDKLLADAASANRWTDAKRQQARALVVENLFNLDQ
ncbi:MAG: DUF1549 domain-containing protein [Planctomycetota bacterium]|nr:DUF1549 domain-containing protein [Planctomycetota bacterium]